MQRGVHRGRESEKCIISISKLSLTKTWTNAFMKLKTKMGSLLRSSNMLHRCSQSSDKSLGWRRTSFLSRLLPFTMFRRFITSSLAPENRQASSSSLITKLLCSKPLKIVKKLSLSTRKLAYYSPISTIWWRNNNLFSLDSMEFTRSDQTIWRKSLASSWITSSGVILWTFNASTTSRDPQLGESSR